MTFHLPVTPKGKRNNATRKEVTDWMIELWGMNSVDRAKALMEKKLCFDNFSHEHKLYV